MYPIDPVGAATLESNTHPRIRLLTITILIGAAIVAGVTLDAAQLIALGEWLDENRSIAAMALFACHVAASLLMLPGWVFIALAGYLFGIPVGLGLAYLSTVTACLAVFGLGRTMARASVRRRLHDSRLLTALDKAVAENGFSIVLLTRLSLVLPLNFLNYGYSVTGVSVTHYVAGTALGMIPAVAVYAFLGASVGDISKLMAGDYQVLDGGWMLWVSLAIAVGVTVWVGRLTNASLKRHLPATETGNLRREGGES